MTNIFERLRKNPGIRSRRGSAMVEVSLMVPLISFLFAGALDMGNYSFALISLANAARVAALYTSTSSATASDSVGACRYVLNELTTLPNINGTLNTCTSGTVTVSAEAVTGAGGIPSSQVSVTYQSLPMIPIPGVLSNQFVWTRTLTMPLRS